MKLEDWAKVDVDEIRERWAKRRKELEEMEKKKLEKEKRIEEAKKRKDEKRRRAIRERRCFVCGIFGHMARYCRNRGEEKKGSTQMPLNKFEVLRDRVMQRGEGSGKEIGKERREILREERKKKIVQVQTLGKDKKEKKKEVDEKKKEIEVEEKKEMEEEREVEMRGFSGGEILKGRYPLVWWKVRCYECGGLGHRRKDHREMKRDRIEKDKKIDKKGKIGKDEIEDKKKDKDKIEKKEVDKRDKKEDKKIEIAREEKKIEEEKKKEKVQA